MKSDPKPDFDPEEIEFAAEFRSTRLVCPGPDLILAAQGDALPPDLRVAVMEHVARCGPCRILSWNLVEPDFLQATPEEEDRIRRRVFGEVKRSRGGSFRKSGFSRFLVPALAAVLMAGIVGLIWMNSLKPPPPPLVAARPQPSAPAAGPSRLEQLLKLEKPPVKLAGRTTLLFRSSGTSKRDERLAQFGRGLDAYRSDNFQEAATRLGEVTRNYPDIAEAYFYLGVSQLFLGAHPEAISAFEKSRQLGTEALTRDIQWYSGLASFRSGRREAAVTAFQALCNSPGDYQAQACDVLKELVPASR